MCNVIWQQEKSKEIGQIGSGGVVAIEGLSMRQQRLIISPTPKAFQLHHRLH